MVRIFHSPGVEQRPIRVFLIFGKISSWPPDYSLAFPKK